MSRKINFFTKRLNKFKKNKALILENGRSFTYKNLITNSLKISRMLDTNKRLVFLLGQNNFETIIGYISADYLNKDIIIGLAIVNPVYFMCMMIGSMKTIQINFSIALGALLGPAFYFISPEWCILFGGLIAGTVAFYLGEKNDN